MSIDVTRNLGDAFSYKGMKNLMGYLGTFNCESQVLAIDATPADIQTTGTKLMMINGQPEVCEEAAALDISACEEGDEDDWAVDTSYSIGDIVMNNSARYRCIVAHTGYDGSNPNEPNNEPGNSDNWTYYWEDAPHGAVNASGAVIEKDESQWFMVTAQADGTLTVWEAGDADAHADAECVIPQYDYKKYCPIGFLLVKNETSSDFTLGTTDLNTASITDTYMNVTGPVIPDSTNWDKN